MDRLKLVLPTAADEQAIWDYREEFLNNNDQHLDGTGGLANVQDFAGWYRKNLAYRSEETTPPDKVPASTYLAVLQQTGELIGMIDIRHRLNDFLLAFGGHIGYSVRPSRRRRGYATRMLAAALEVCRELGLSRVMIACDSENAASARTIERCGGVMENEAPEDGRLTRRYWIDL